MNKRFVKQPSLKDSLPKKAQPTQGSNGVSKGSSIPDFGSDRPSALSEKMAYLKANANFESKKMYVKDGVFLHLFVRHQAFDRSGVELPNDGSFFPAE